MPLPSGISTQYPDSNSDATEVVGTTQEQEAREISEALLLEVSDMSPVQYEQFREFGLAIQSYVTKEYGKYIPDGNMPQIEAATLNAIALNRVDFERFVQVYQGKSLLERLLTKVVPSMPVEDWRPVQSTGVGGITIAQKTDHKEKKVIVLDRNARQFPEKITKEIAAAFFEGDEEQAADLLSVAWFTRAHAHEVIHALGDNFTPVQFQELGVRYYEKGVPQEIIPNMPCKDPVQDAAHDHYERLVTKYGEDVHRLFFGSKVDSETKKEILKDTKVIGKVMKEDFGDWC